jgi:copper oxidase (laccase) domain-containing protein
MGAKPDHLGVLIGPGIGPCCYNVGEDVALAFRNAGFSEEIFEQRGGATFLDLKKANRRLAEAEGVREIDDVGLCTACRRDLFFSARRDKPAGRQINFVLLKRGLRVYSSRMDRNGSHAQGNR